MLECAAVKCEQLEDDHEEDSGCRVRGWTEPGAPLAFGSQPKERVCRDQWEEPSRHAIPAPCVDRRSQTKIRDEGDVEQKGEGREHSTQRSCPRAQAEPSAPGTGQERRDLQLPVRHRGVQKQLPRITRGRHEQACLVEQDEQEERQQRDRAQVKRHRHGLVVLAIQEVGRGVQPGEREGQDDKRTKNTVDLLVPSCGYEIEAAAKDEEKGPEIERDLRIRECAAHQDPVVLAHVERRVGGLDAFGLMRIDQAEPQPFAHFLDVGPHPYLEGRGVHGRPRQN